MFLSSLYTVVFDTSDKELGTMSQKSQKNEFKPRHHLADDLVVTLRMSGVTDSLAAT